MAQEYPTFVSTNFIIDTPEVVTKRTEAIRSSFSGTTPPSNPTEGQWWLKSDTEENFQYLGTEWVLDPSRVLNAEVTAARGSTANLNARLSVALNEDGTVKETVPVTANKWIEETETIEFVDATSFTVEGDLTAIYIADRALNLTQTTSDIVYVLESTAAGSPIKTTVTVKGGIVDSGLSKVEYSTFVSENMPSNPPLLINSLTPKTTLADNDKGVFEDSEASNAKKSFSFLSVWNYIKGKINAESAFSVELSSDYSANDNTIVPFNVVEYDANNDFDTDENAFIAPVDGIYFLGNHYAFSAVGNSPSIRSSIGGINLLGVNANINFGGELIFTTGKTFKLDEGDSLKSRVRVGSTASNYTISSANSSFFGYLIREI